MQILNLTNQVEVKEKKEQKIFKFSKFLCFEILVDDTQEFISSFSWHNSNQHRILTVSTNGIVEMVSLQETIPLAWSPHGFITFGSGKSLVMGEIGKSQTNGEIFDVSLQMKKRAEQGYSMDVLIFIFILL